MARKPQPSAARATPPDEGARPPPIQTFRYEKPAGETRTRAIMALCESDILRGQVQIVGPGGADNLHSHTAMDEFWMVLSGRARFYGPGNVLFGEFEPFDGLLIPRNTRYRCESVGDGDLELLQVGALDRFSRDERIDAEPPKYGADTVEHFSGRVL